VSEVFTTISRYVNRIIYISRFKLLHWNEDLKIKYVEDIKKMKIEPTIGRGHDLQNAYNETKKGQHMKFDR
jgi:hypothetical protein